MLRATWTRGAAERDRQRLTEFEAPSRRLRRGRDDLPSVARAVEATTLQQTSTAAQDRWRFGCGRSAAARAVRPGGVAVGGVVDARPPPLEAAGQLSHLGQTGLSA